MRPLGSHSRPTDLRLLPGTAEAASERPLVVPAFTVMPAPAAPAVRSVPSRIRAMVVGPQRLARTGISALLDSEDDLAVAGDADPEEAVALAAELRPDVIVLDAGPDEEHGLELTRRLVGATPAGEGHVLLTLGGETDASMVEALHAGATGLLLRDSDADELLGALRQVAHGEPYLSPRLMRRLVPKFLSFVPDRHATPPELSDLTAREREVMAMVAAGLEYDEIAERLVVSPATVKTHVHRTLRKLDARDRAQLVALAYELGLVQVRRR
jgi:DNA-binding NarL/FixJ family response regulator